MAPGRRVLRAGFTLAEVLFAIFVLGIGLIMLAAAFPVGVIESQQVQDTTVAALVARHAFNQITSVPAPQYRPNDDWTKQDLSSSPVAGFANYRGKPILSAFLDGTLSDLGGTAAPDLRAKVLFPVPVPIADGIGIGLDPSNPVGRDDFPQSPETLGEVIDPAVDPRASFGWTWGFRSQDVIDPITGQPKTLWEENVQWTYPADRRYYWYAFYRQMFDGVDFPHPTLFGTQPTDAQLLDRVQADRITRRTYQVLIVVCRVPSGWPPFKSAAEYYDNFMKTNDAAFNPQAYLNQWVRPLASISMRPQDRHRGYRVRTSRLRSLPVTSGAARSSWTLGAAYTGSST